MNDNKNSGEGSGSINKKMGVFGNRMLMEKIRQNKKIPKKYQASIFTFKKEFLFKNMHNKYSEGWVKEMMKLENKIFYQ